MIRMLLVVLLWSWISLAQAAGQSPPKNLDKYQTIENIEMRMREIAKQHSADAKLQPLVKLDFKTERFVDPDNDKNRP